MADSRRKKKYLAIRGDPLRSGGVALVSYSMFICYAWRFMSPMYMAAGGGWGEKRRTDGKITPEMTESSRKKQYLPGRGDPYRPGGVSVVAYCAPVRCVTCCM